MHEFTTCLILWCKRFLRRPLFLFTLLLMPVSVLLLKHSQGSGDAVIRVALYAPEDGSDKTAGELVQEMVSLSNSAILFYNCSTAAALRTDVKEGTAACGYILPENLSEKLREFTKSQTPYILACRSKEDMRTRIVDEIVVSKLYQQLAYYRLSQFLSLKQDASPDDGWLRETYEKHSSTDLLFHFEYANGEENSLLNSEHTNYMLMPVRGIVSVMVLLSCLTGGFFLYTDKSNALFLANPRKRRLCSLLSLLVPGIFSGTAGLITIKMTGISVSPVTEITAMILYLLCCMSLTNVLCTIFCREFYLAAIPLIVIGSLVFSPVFINLESIIPNLAPVSRLFPAAYYLSAIYFSSSSILTSTPAVYSILFISCSAFFATLYSRIKG